MDTFWGTRFYWFARWILLNCTADFWTFIRMRCMNQSLVHKHYICIHLGFHCELISDMWKRHLMRGEAREKYTLLFLLHVTRIWLYYACHIYITVSRRLFVHVLLKNFHRTFSILGSLIWSDITSSCYQTILHLLVTRQFFGKRYERSN